MIRLLCLWAMLSTLDAPGGADTPPSVAPRQCANPEDVARWFTTIHAQMWRRMTPDALATILDGARLQVIDAPYPEGASAAAQPCSGSVISTNQTQSSSCFVWAVFDRVRQGGACGLALQSVSYRGAVPLGVAVNLATESQRALKVGGKPVGNQWDETYTWRSKDSKAVFELVASITVQKVELKPDTQAT